MPRIASAVTAIESSIPTANADLRISALKRLYSRREAVDELIRSLEQYQKVARPKALRIPFSAVSKCS